MGSQTGGGYTASPSSLAEFRRNVDRSLKEFSINAQGKFAVKGEGRSQRIYDVNPEATAKKLYETLSAGGEFRPLPGEGYIRWFDDGTHVTYRPTRTSDGNPVVEVTTASPGSKPGCYQKVNFTKEPAHDAGNYTKRQHSFTFSRDDLIRLAELVGGSWRYVSGKTLTHHLNTPIDVIIGTSGNSVRVVSEIAEADFEGNAEMYAALSVSADVSGLDEAQRKGNVYIHFQREKINDIWIIRDVVTEVSGGELRWEYTTDVGLVFELSGGAVAVVKGSHHTEMLLVRMALSVEQLYLPDRVIEWDDDLTAQHYSSREFIPIEKLFGR
jgi:hypothetical protein